MRYKIYKDGECINTIVADLSFVHSYCTKNGYTYEQEQELEFSVTIPTETELLSRQLTDLQLDQIEQGQFATELQLQMMEANANV